MNTALRNFQINMVNLINSAQLPTEAKRLVVCDILYKLEAQAEIDIKLEAQQTEEKESEEE